MPVYNKLVRDRIPEIIQKDNKQCTTKILDAEEYVIELKEKLEEELKEELKEYQEATSHKDALEELADILELIHALAETHDSTIKEVEEIRKNKAIKRGGFKDKIYLIEVED